MPFRVEHIEMPPGLQHDYSWDGSTAYLGLHDIMLQDGEVRSDGLPVNRQRDWRRRLSFAPEGVSSRGWSETTQRHHSLTALYLNQNWLLENMEQTTSTLRPWMCFQNEQLLSTMQKLGIAARSGHAPKLMMGALTMLAGAELISALTGRRNEDQRGGLSDRQLKNATAFIDAHITVDIGLDEIAAAAGLSPYHFSRAFKVSTGVTPYQYVLQSRIERAKALLRDGATPIGTIAAQVGFNSSSQFSRRFMQATGVAPRAYRNGSPG